MTTAREADPLVIRRLEFLGGQASVTGWKPASDLPEIAFSGRSNVGKSSLLNTLVRRKALARVERAGFERIRFGWAGSTRPAVPHYYRLQGPTFVLEFDNSRNSGTHIHSVWRDFERDFGRHLL